MRMACMYYETLYNRLYSIYIYQSDCNMTSGKFNCASSHINQLQQELVEFEKGSTMDTLLSL